MQVNAEAFYQLGFGIRPLYLEAQGSLRTLDGLQAATDQQLSDLEEFMKKERHRWHPDKLRLRNGRAGGVSNVLARDPASRAILQAVNDILAGCRAELARRGKVYQRFV